ncbi:MAG TPA: ABC transporter permease [Reyranella sp.]|nr:ABC transporter permease [Reyranella sp.]
MSLDLVRRLFATRFGGTGAVILVAISLLSIFAPLFATTGPLDVGLPSLQPPSWAYPLGTDSIGRDVRSILLYAGRSSLTIGFSAAAMAFLIGGTMGALAGYFRGPLAAVLLRITDLFHTLPAIIIVLFTVALMGASFWLQVAAVALAIWPIEARLMYGQFITLSEREFVLAARAAGLPTFHMIFREILPNAVPVVIVQVALDASTAILIEAGLGFLGLADPTRPSWGEMLNRGQEYLDPAWWMSVFPGMAIAIAVLGFNLFADGVTEMFNPRASANVAPKLEG